MANGDPQIRNDSGESPNPLTILSSTGTFAPGIHVLGYDGAASIRIEAGRWDRDPTGVR